MVAVAFSDPGTGCATLVTLCGVASIASAGVVPSPVAFSDTLAFAGIRIGTANAKTNRFLH